MQSYISSELRNIVLLGHCHCGKTTLASAILRTSRAPGISSQAEDGISALLCDEEEISRGMTMSSAIAFTQWADTKVNLIDTPGFHTFLHEAQFAMLAAETAVIVVNAQNGIEAVTNAVWRFAESASLPRILVINQLDRAETGSTASREQLLATMRERWGRQVIPVQLPIIDGQGFHGIVDLVSMQALLYSPGGDGRGITAAIPEPLKAEAQAAHESLVELVAEGKEDLMEEFFAVGTIPFEHLVTALHEATREDRIFPVLYASGLHNIGTDQLIEFFRVYAPAAKERSPFPVRRGPLGGDGAARNSGHRAVDDAGLPTLYVYKTLIDPFAGRLSFFKVISGVIRADATLENYLRGETEKLGHLAVMQGRKPIEVPELHAGDLGAVSKLRVTRTGDTLGAKGQAALIDNVTLPEPVMAFAIEPRSRADEDKLVPALQKIAEEDLLLRFYRDPQTGEFLVAGMGQLHIEALVAKLRRRYHAEVTLKAPKVPYRETIRSKGSGHGRYKKQTGGHGQFADCKIRIEPLARGAGFEFVSEIFGGAIPRQYVPAVEKGVQEAAARGQLAGYPLVDFRAVVYDGSYHEVDSSEMAFKMAGRLAFRACMNEAKPALLEPVMAVEVETPDVFAGAVMGDLNGRRGRVQGMEARAGKTLVRAQAPLAEMLSYGAILTSMTQGQGVFRMEMDHYDYVPSAISEKLAANAKLPAAEEAE